MSDLTDPRQALELVHALLSKRTDTLTLRAENASRTEETTVSVHTDTALTLADTAPPVSVSVSAPSVYALTVTNAVQDEKNPPSVSASVHFLGKELPTRDPDPREALTRRLLEAGAALGWKQDTLAGWETWATTAPVEALENRVRVTEARLNLKRDPDPSGCPTHWQRVPELPPRGSRVAMVDAQGFGNLYRFKVKGTWYLLKFLPPYDGRVSLTDQQGVVRVLASLEEAASWLAWLAQADDGDVLPI